MNLNWKFPTKWKQLPREDYQVRGKKNVYRVPLMLEEPLKTGRTNHPVTSGVPIPEGWLDQPEHCRLLDEKRRELPLQTQALARWPDGSVKWLLLDFQFSTRSLARRRVTLELGKNVRPKVRHKAPVSVIEIADGVEVQTGHHRFEITHEKLPLDLKAVFTVRSTEGDRDGKYTASAEEIKIEERGPLRAVIRVSGWHYREDGRKSMPFILRFTAWAGTNVLGVQHTFIISDDPLTTFWRGIGLEIPAAQEVRALVRWSDLLHPKENVFDRERGVLGVYVWPMHGEEMDLRPVLVRRPPDFVEWTEKHPDSFHHIEGGALSKEEAEDAFGMRKPCQSMGDMRGRSGKGMAKTHEIFIGTAADDLQPFDAPLFARATPQYYATTKAFGQFHPYDPQNFAAIEKAMEAHLTWVWRHIHEWSKWTGIFDYGDYLSIYDKKRGAWWKYDGGRWGWLNGEVNSEQGLFVQFLRTGKRRWLDFAEAAARHRIDCDQLHWHDQFPELIGGMHRHYMLEHWSGQIDCGHIWVDGAMNLYYLFGFRRGLECAIDGAEMAARFCIPIVLHHGDTSRETNNGLRCLARVYEATGDERYREMADVIARGYVCCFDESGWPLSLADSEKNLQREFAGTEWWQWPEIINYNWHGNCGYQYIGYLAPAVRYWATVGRTPHGLELQRRFDCYSPALDLGNEGQFFGEMWLETKDPRYLLPIVRGLPGTIQFPVPADGKGAKPGSYFNPRLDYLCGIPYVLAAFYDARKQMKEFEPKPSAKIPSYRAPAKKKSATTAFDCLDLSATVNADPRRNPFHRALEDEYAHALPALKSGQIGFQPYNGGHALQEGYRPVSAMHIYPSSADAVVTNNYAVAGMPFGGEVEYAGVPFRFVKPDANNGKAIIVLGANQSVTIPVGRTGDALYVLGHVHGRKSSRQISQFAPKPIGHYEIKYADGSVMTTELINGIHFDSLFNHAYATGVTHVGNYDWMHVFANLTDDRQHLNVMRLPLEAKTVESITLRSTNEDWGLLLVAVTIETVGTRHAVPLQEIRDIAWEDLPGWPDVKERRRGNKFCTPCRLKTKLPDGFYEVELTVNGDPNPYAAPHLRVECDGAQVLTEYSLPGGGKLERVRFIAKARLGTLALDLFPASNHATGKLPQLGHGKGSYAVGSYGNWRAPAGNFTRIEQVRVRPVNVSEVRWPRSSELRYGFLLPGATGEAARGGLVVDHEDTDDFTPTTMKWKAGGFRADLPNGRYKVILHHTNYAAIGTIQVELKANGEKVFAGTVDYETVEFETESRANHITLEWRQPTANVRCPRYAIRGIVFERV